jgi:hypothetical protein
MAARVALPTGGNPASTSCSISFVVDGVTETPPEVLGWAVTESTGSAAAKIRLHDGADASGPELAPLIVLASGGESSEFVEQGIQLSSGKVWLEVVSGSVEISVYW